MAAGKWKAYDMFKLRVEDGTIDLDSNTINAALFLSTSNANTLSVGTGLYGDLTNEVATANGYTQLGAAVTGKTITNSSGTTTWTCVIPDWTASGGSITARFCVLYVAATVNTIVKPLIAVSLLNTTPADETATTGNPFRITVSASGVFQLSGATTD